MDGENIYLTYNDAGDREMTDTAVIYDGMFVFTGKLEQPCVQAMIYMGDINDYRNPNSLFFYLEPKEMAVAVDMAQFRKPVISGSLTQAEMDSLTVVMEALREEAVVLQKTIETESDPDTRNKLSEQLVSYTGQIRQVQLDFVKTHPYSYAVPDLLRFLLSGMTYQELKDIYDALDASVKQLGSMEEIEKQLEALEHTQPGSLAPDFTAVDINGDSIRFSETVEGKYVLLDFWASWCVPCRKAFPHVKEVAEKYKEDGLVVFCVADNDSSPDSWREAINKDGLSDFIHVLRGFNVDNNTHKADCTYDIMNLYAVHLLPSRFLIDNKFKIIGKMDSEEELDNKLKEIFGK